MRSKPSQRRRYDEQHGGFTPVAGINLTFDDEAAAGLPLGGPLVSGSFKPTNLSPFDNFNSPAPAGPYGSLLSAFDNKLPNGTWSLYIRDFSAGDSGLLSGGFSLQISVPEPSSLILWGLGLFSIAALLRRKER